MTIHDVASAAQNLANYIYREGEAADPAIVSSQIDLLSARNIEVQTGRIREMVEKG